MSRESKRRAKSEPAGGSSPVAALPRAADAGEAPTAGEQAAEPERLAPGLYLVATPIGHASDITLRALDVLARADAIAAEDTRRTRQLLEIHGISLAGRPLTSYHDRNGPSKRPQIVGWLEDGLSVAYCSDAGTPLVAAPGYRLVEAAIEGGHGLTALPGPSAALAALSLSGLPTDRFLFAGFMPAKSAARRRALGEVAGLAASLVVYESPRRLGECLADMAAVLGDLRVAVCRELTKRFEEVVRGRLSDLAARYGAEAPRGEIVVVVGPAEGDGAAGAGAEAEAALETQLTEALGRLSLRDATDEVAARLGLKRKAVYARALEIARQAEDTREERDEDG